MSEKKNQILGDAIKAYGGRTIKLGADCGSGFFYVGSVELLNENAEEYDQQLKAAARNSAAVHKKSRDSMASNPPTLTSYVMEELHEDKPMPSFHDYMKSVAAWMKACVKKEEAYRAAIDRAENFQCLMKREVIRIQEADKIADEGVLIIVVRGGERGKYWISGEANGEPFGLMGDTEEDEEE